MQKGREGNTGEERGSNEQKKGRVQKKDERERVGGEQGRKERKRRKSKVRKEGGALYTSVLARPFWSGAHHLVCLVHHLVSSRKPFCTTWLE